MKYVNFTSKFLELMSVYPMACELEVNRGFGHALLNILSAEHTLSGTFGACGWWALWIAWGVKIILLRGSPASPLLYHYIPVQYQVNCGVNLIGWVVCNMFWCTVTTVSCMKVYEVHKHFYHEMTCMMWKVRNSLQSGMTQKYHWHNL